MRTTIDRAGRVVVPKQLRESLDLTDGTELDISVRDGVLEMEPVSTPMRLVGEGRHVHAETDVEMPTLYADQVRDVLEQVRR